MADPDDTKEAYLSTCHSLEHTPNKTILLMFEKAIQLNEKSTIDRYNLYIAGNNKEITDTHLSDNDFVALCTSLKDNVFITGIDARYNDIADEGAKALGTLLQDSVSLLKINLMCNNIGPLGAEAIARGLQFGNETLVSLSLNGNNICVVNDDEFRKQFGKKFNNNGAMGLAGMLQVNTALEHLDLNDCDLDMESVIAFATVLCQNKFIRSINLSRPLLFSHQEETTVHIAKMLRINRTLKELHLMKYDMRDHGAERLAEALAENTSLTYLNLSCNRITRDGTKHIAKMLENNTTLETLDLGYNRLEDDGAQYLSKALQGNFTLTSLVVVHNNIGPNGLCYLAASLSINTALKQLYIWGNSFNESVCDAFSDLVSSERMKQDNTDVKAYTVDEVTYLCELSNGIRPNYYWTPSYGPNSHNSIIEQATM